MVSKRCKMAVKKELLKLGLHFIVVDLGEVEIMETLDEKQLALLDRGLHESGLELIKDKQGIIIEKIINAITEMIHYKEEAPKLNCSNYLSKKIGYDYTYLSNIFSAVKGITIQQFIILHKIEKVKEYLIYAELNLTEISYLMHYSSVAHLSNQFKKVTGFTPTEFMKLNKKTRIPLEDVGIRDDINQYSLAFDQS